MALCGMADIFPLDKIVDSLDLHAPMLKGLQDAHAYVCETLENLVFDMKVSTNIVAAAAYLYGQ